MAAKAKTVTIASKPHLVPALRSTWRASAEQRVMQVWRFLRLYVFSFVGQVLVQAISTALAGDEDITQLGRKAFAALLIPAAEVVWRQQHPALTASAVDSAPGATVVPAQVTPPPPVPEGAVVDTPPEGDAAP